MDLYIILIALYMFLGLVMFEWAWIKVRAIREIDEDRDGKYPAFRRWDAKDWKKWKFYFGAVTVMPLRVFLSILTIFMVYILVK